MKKKIPHKIDKHLTIMLAPCDVPGCKNTGNFASALNKKTNKLMNFCERCTKTARFFSQLDFGRFKE